MWSHVNQDEQKITLKKNQDNEMNLENAGQVSFHFYLFTKFGIAWLRGSVDTMKHS